MSKKPGQSKPARPTYVYAIHWTDVFPEDALQIWSWEFFLSEKDFLARSEEVRLELVDLGFDEEDLPQLVNRYAWRVPKTPQALLKILQLVSA